MLTRTTIDGRKDNYKTWLASVCQEADAMKLPDSIREQITGAMLKDAWSKHECPRFFLEKCAEYFA